MYFYFVNVSLSGRHFFTTERNGIGIESHANHVYDEMVSRFPASEGFEVTLTRWENPMYTEIKSNK